MLGTTPPTSQLDWLISTTAMIVLFWSRATRDLLKSFGWGIAALHRLKCSDEVATSSPPAHRIFPFRARATTVVGLLAPDRSSLGSPLGGTGVDPWSPHKTGWLSAEVPTAPPGRRSRRISPGRGDRSTVRGV